MPARGLHQAYSAKLVGCPTDGQQHQRTQKEKKNDTARHGNSNMNDREWNLYQSPRLCVDVPHTRCALGSAQHAALAPPTRKRNCCVKPIVRCPTKSLSSCPLLSQPFRRGLLALAIVYGTVAGVESEGFGGAWDRGGRLDNGGPPGLVRFGVIVSHT